MFTVTDEVMKKLVNALQASLNEKSYKNILYGAATLVFTFYNLSINERNKLMIAKSKAMPLLIQLLDPETRRLDSPDSMNTIELTTAEIWQLSFDEEVKCALVPSDASRGQLCLETPSSLLYRLQAVVDNKYGNENAVKNAQGALWLLLAGGEVEVTSGNMESYIPDVTRNSSTEEAIPDTDTTGSSHVMISYNWANQPRILKLRSVLGDTGIPVWIDVKSMKGSILDAMADAVEKASIVTMCISSKYKESANCRLEAEFAVQQKKKIIPLMVEKDYRPSGWLGIIMGQKLWYDFTSDDFSSEAIQSLLHEIGVDSFGSVGDVVNAVPSKVGQPAAVDVASLDVDGVQSLLSATSIHGDILTAFRDANIDGKSLYVLQQWNAKQPEFFLAFVRDQLGLLCMSPAQLMHLAFVLMKLP